MPVCNLEDGWQISKGPAICIFRDLFLMYPSFIVMSPGLQSLRNSITGISRKNTRNYSFPYNCLFVCVSLQCLYKIFIIFEPHSYIYG
jgi:hypothetical protein